MSSGRCSISPTALSLGSSTAGATILVLDDDPSILTIVQLLLESRGRAQHDVRLRRPSFTEHLAAPRRPAVMDVRMGEVSGIELARELRTLPAYRDLPIVLISADTEARRRSRRDAPASTTSSRSPSRPGPRAPASHATSSGSA
jgi:two-component system chemotaxis response regulator CheY